MKTFEELGIVPSILQAIAEMGYESPMPVQEQVIPLLLGEETDLIALAQTGTGKTAAFGLPLLQRIDINKLYPQALIMAPTRELCLQIAGDLADYAKYIPNLHITPVYGGANIEVQIRALRKGSHVVVATPGRLLDLINRGCISLSKTTTVIMDEADEMLNMGFLDSINEILAFVPENRKMLLFSATMPAGIEQIARNYMNNPKEIVVGSRNEGAENVRHIYYMVKANDKYLALKRIADYCPDIYGIIFCRTRRETQEIADALISDGYNAESLHGDLSQMQRDLVMQKFRVRNIQLLVATDVAARGLDVTDLTHVINYGLPDDIETYTHRSGRTGRAGKSGVSVAIVHSREKGKIRAIEKIIGKTFEREHIPSGKQICEKQLFNLVDRIEKVEVNETEIEPLLPPIFRRLSWLDDQDLIRRFISLEFNRLLEYYRDAPDIDLPDEKPRSERKSKGKDDRREKGSCQAEPGYTRIYINQGKATGCTPYNILDLINEHVPVRINIGRIDLFTGYSLIDVEEKFSRRVVAALKHADFYGNRIYAEIADPNKKYGGEGNRGKGKGKERDVKDNEKPRGERRNSRSARNEEKPRNERGRNRRGEGRFQNEERPTRRSRHQDNKGVENNESFNYEISAGKPMSRKRRK
ncbi:MAG: DEAD/DEAH box helicase [Bacteroidaceae bacterium]|nr:DEAD/DEAH box helicase [Bacteroidaceae bacterium]